MHGELQPQSDQIARVRTERGGSEQKREPVGRREGPAEGRMPDRRPEGGSWSAGPPAAEGGALGNYSELVLAQHVGNDEEDFSYGGLNTTERRRVRFGARALLWKGSSLKAVRCCGRLISSEDFGVTVRSSGRSRRMAGFRQLGRLRICMGLSSLCFGSRG